MKILKKIFFIICALLLAGCGFILVCALNPSLTDKLASALYHQGKSAGSAGGSGLDGAGGGITGEEAGIGGASGSGGGNGAGIGDNSGSGGAGSAADSEVPEGVLGSVPSGTGYTPPAEASVRAPDEVAGRTGYVPVQESGEQVPEDAGEWKSEAGVGDTGEGLTFDPEFYPYYAMLNGTMQSVYRQIYANAQALNTVFAPVESIGFRQLKSVFEAVYNDHPELFWLETGYSCKYLKSGECAEITLKYNSTADNLDQARSAFDAGAAQILDQAGTLGSAEEKERYVHDALIAGADYNLGADKSQSAYSALVDGESVCAGYARAFQYLLQKLGIPCYYCTGFSGESHAWNIVKLDGEYYNVDPTWNDTDPATYDYYNKSDAEFASSHARRGLSIYLPACGASDGTAGQSGGASGGTAGQSGGASDDTAGQSGGASDGTAGQSGGAADNGSGQAPEGEAPAEHLDKPLAYVPDLSWQAELIDEGADGSTENAAALESLGLTEDDVLGTMEKYYEDCYNQLIKAGTGSVEFQNVIPKALWETLEQAYTSGSYEQGYIEKALEKLEAEDFTVRLWAERLGNGYYKLYHNVVTE